MPDKVLICQNCHNHFVYSDFEQTEDLKHNNKSPLYCPICQSIKNQETKRPAKPKTREV